MLLAGVRLRSLDHRADRTDEVIHSNSQLVDALIGSDFAFSERNHRSIEASGVVSQLVDTTGQRSHHCLKPRQAFFVPGLTV